MKFARVVMFTVEEINRNTKLLPGVSLGYRLFNGCGSENLIRAAIEAVNGEDSKSCSGQIQAVLGHSSSGVSEDINIQLSSLSIAQVRRNDWGITALTVQFTSTYLLIYIPSLKI